MIGRETIEELLLKNSHFKLYLADEDRSLTMNSLIDMCKEYCEVFRKSSKDIVILEFSNDLDSLLVYLSCLLQNQSVMLISRSQMKDIFSLIELYEPQYIFSSQSIFLNGSSYLCNDSIPKLFVRKQESKISITSSNVALLLSTSGSTGSPKFVSLSLRNILSNAFSISKSLGLLKTDVAITTLPLFYSYGLSILNSHLFCGGGIVLSDKGILDRELWNQIRRYNVTSLAGVPYVYQMLQRLGVDEILNTPSLRYLTQAGGKLSNSLVQYFDRITKESGRKFFVMYGQTEACARMSCLDSDFLPLKMGSVGRAIDEGKFSILEPDLQTGIGEIAYNGPNVMLGYVSKKEDLNQGDINCGYLRTGDMGYLDADGFLYITSRVKRIAKIAGVRISLDEVEQKLSQKDQIVAISRDEKIILYTVNENINLDKLKQMAVEVTDAHPSHFIVKYIQSLPFTLNGKIDYKKLEG